MGLIKAMFINQLYCNALSTIEMVTRHITSITMAYLEETSI